MSVVVSVNRWCLVAVTVTDGQCQEPWSVAISCSGQCRGRSVAVVVMTGVVMDGQ